MSLSEEWDQWADTFGSANKEGWAKAMELVKRTAQLEAKAESLRIEANRLYGIGQEYDESRVKLESDVVRLKKELRDERTGRLVEWLADDKIDQEQFDEAVAKLNVLEAPDSIPKLPPSDKGELLERHGE